MAKPVHVSYQLLLLIFILSVHLSSQLQFSQFQTLVKVQQLLNYPSLLSSLNNTTDFCNIEPTSSLTLVCYEDNLTQLHITGNNGVPPLPEYFSSDTFFATLGSLSSLKVLSLVSLGLWGQLPGSIVQLSSLEILNLSSNHFNGSIPGQVSSLRNLQTLILDHNNFIGRVPGWLGSLQVLSVLSLKNNSLSGFLPSSLSGLQSLRMLSLSANHLSGEIPGLHNLSNLQVLDLQDNYFGPHFPSLHKKLVTLVLRNNGFQFGIPAELSSYHELQKLDISLNGFVGPFPPSLISLPSITYLDIHGNKLTGLLSQNLSCNPELAYVDLSTNLLTGDLPSCLQLNTKGRLVLYSENCLSNEEQVQHPSNFCHNEALAVKVLPHKQKNKNPNAKSVLASSMVGGTVGGIAIVGVVLLVIRKVQNKNTVEKPSTRLILENASTVNTVKLLSDAKYISQTMKLGASLPAYRSFTLEELKEATDNFHTSSFVCESSHGQIYRGKLTDGTLVAIRSLKMTKRHSHLMHTHHIELISKLRHSHLVSALGHCFDFSMDDSTITTTYLIFEYASNRTLRSCMSGFPGQKLTWIQRISAAIGVVKGVQFLHTGIVPGIFSNNLKVTDVLLDQNLHVKINCYDLPLLAKTTRKGSAEISSPAIKASILARTQQDDRSDVYDIGVILLEIIVGRPIASQYDVVIAKDLLQVSITMDHAARKSVIDPAVMNECSEESLKTMMELCLRCLSNEPTDRPSVEDVLWNLQFAAQVQNSTQNNQESV
ncbi:Protein kinase [Melia azedarach]|uniref:Protein kinase n=1 Tax=Melia azedarach TaxID=155640 RepID=A0ACC1YB27_MELAZ|nr:Protein kinase [Melia azedarach]